MSQQLRDVVFHWSHVQLLAGLQIIVHCGVVSLLKRMYLSIVRYNSQCSAHLTSLGILLFSVKYIRLFWCFYLILKFYPFMLDKCSCCLCHQKVSMPTGAFFLKFTLLVYFYFHWWQLSTNEQKSNIKNKLSWKVVVSFLEIYKGFFEVQTFMFFKYLFHHLYLLWWLFMRTGFFKELPLWITSVNLSETVTCRVEEWCCVVRIEANRGSLYFILCPRL